MLLSPGAIGAWTHYCCFLCMARGFILCCGNRASWICGQDSGGKREENSNHFSVIHGLQCCLLFVCSDYWPHGVVFMVVAWACAYDECRTSNAWSAPPCFKPTNTILYLLAVGSAHSAYQDCQFREMLLNSGCFALFARGPFTSTARTEDKERTKVSQRNRPYQSHSSLVPRCPNVTQPRSPR